MRISDWSSDVCSSYLPAVGLLHQPLERVGAAIGAMRCEGQDAVVAPAALARELGDGHKLDRGDAGPHEMVQPAAHAVEGAILGEGPDMQLGDHRFLPEIGRASCRERVCQYV